MKTSLTSVVILMLVTASIGCNESPVADKQAPKETGVFVKDSEPGVIEIQKATARLDDLGIARFEIAYRFTKGSPTRNYKCEITFPGTSQRGERPLDAWEMKPEGVIKTGIEIGDNPVREFEIIFSEADSPDRGYTTMSNTLKGEVQPREVVPAEVVPDSAATAN